MLASWKKCLLLLLLPLCSFLASRRAIQATLRVDRDITGTAINSDALKSGTQEGSFVLSSSSDNASTTTEYHPPVSSLSSTTNSSRKKALLVIATVPRSLRHIVSLWTILECFTADFDHVVLSAPHDKKDLMERIVQQVVNVRNTNTTLLPAQPQLSTRYYVNDFYDVGLWCNALDDVLVGSNQNNTTSAIPTFSESHPHPYTHVVLTNDSVFALRHYNGVLRRIQQQQQQYDLVSLCFSYSRNTYWVESILRGYTMEGLSIFRRHSCGLPMSDPRRCVRPNRPVMAYQCIIRQHEVAQASWYTDVNANATTANENDSTSTTSNDTRRRVMGLFAAENSLNHHWIHNVEYWRELVFSQGFPVAKVKERSQHIAGGRLKALREEALLQNCTQHLDWNWVEEIRQAAGLS